MYKQRVNSIFAPQLTKVNKMYAIVDIAGKQFKVSKDQFIYAPSVTGDTGASVEFDRVLLMGDDNGFEVGSPIISGAKVTGTILDHGRGDKVIVFKKKRRKGYRKTQGHRQGYTKIMIDDVLAKGQKASAKTETKAAPAKEKAAPKQESKKSDASQDDLKAISGIGPVFEGELNQRGYTTFKQISKLTENEMEKLSEIDGVTADLIKNEDWVGQAKELMNPSEKKEAKAKEVTPDDLKEIVGIGPVFEKELHDRGYTTFAQISKLTEEDMETLAEVDGLTADLIKNEDWVGQAKKLMKK